MFRTTITNPISPLTNDFISGMSRVENEPDYSLVSLAYAVFRDRIKDYNGMAGIYASKETQIEALQDFKTRVENADNQRPLFCYYKYTKNDPQADEKFVSDELGNMKVPETVISFIKSKVEIEIKILISQDKNAVGVFVNSNDFVFYHLCLSFVPLFYPNIFSANPMTKEELSIFKSLSSKDSGLFTDSVSAVLKKYEKEIRTYSITKLFTNMFERKLRSAKVDIDNLNSHANQAYDQYINYYNQLVAAREKYEGIVVCQKDPTAITTIAKDITENENIVDFQTAENTIDFVVATTLQGFASGAWETFKRRGHIYDGDYGVTLRNGFEMRENRELLLNSLFDDDYKFQIKMCGVYILNIKDNRLDTRSGYDYTSRNRMFETYIPNTHLQKHGCLGAYRIPVTNALKEGNISSAIHLCIASAGSINPDETSQTFRPFIGSILSSEKKILIGNDGKEYTPAEALTMLKEESKPKKKTTTKRKVKDEENNPDEG